MAEALAEVEETHEIDERDDAAVAERVDDAGDIVRKYMYWGGAVGLLPIPLLDLALLSGAQIKMLSELTELYGHTWKEKVARNAVTGLVSGVAAYGVTRYVTSLFKAVPGAGAVAGVLTQTAVGAALTYAIGRVFILHYETGGTLMSFDPKKMREHFKQVYAEAVNKEKQGQRVSYAGIKP